MNCSSNNSLFGYWRKWRKSPQIFRILANLTEIQRFKALTCKMQFQQFTATLVYRSLSLAEYCTTNIVHFCGHYTYHLLVKSKDTFYPQNIFTGPEDWSCTFLLNVGKFPSITIPDIIIFTIIIICFIRFSK